MKKGDQFNPFIALASKNERKKWCELALLTEIAKGRAKDSGAQRSSLRAKLFKRRKYVNSCDIIQQDFNTAEFHIYISFEFHAPLQSIRNQNVRLFAFALVVLSRQFLIPCMSREIYFDNQKIKYLYHRIHDTIFCHKITYLRKLSFSSLSFSASFALYLIRRSIKFRFSSCKEMKFIQFGKVFICLKPFVV